MTRSERLLAIVQFMRGRQLPSSAAVIASEFGVSARTIYRDIAVLVSRGALIEGSSGFGYVIKPGMFLPPLSFEPDEMDAIVLGLRFAMRRGDPALARGAHSALAKLAEVVPQQGGNLGYRVGLVAGPRASDDLHVLALTRAAIHRQRKLCIAYANAAGKLSERIVWPVLVGFLDDAELLAAWCEDRHAFRHFRIDRIQKVMISEDHIPGGRARLLSRYREIEPDVTL